MSPANDAEGYLRLDLQRPNATYSTKIIVYHQAASVFAHHSPSSPSGYSLNPGQTRELFDTAFSKWNENINAGFAATWTTSNPSVVTVSSNQSTGLVQALNCGTATITSTRCGIPGDRSARRASVAAARVVTT